ncbi:MAG: mRNA surveillance protein pelota [Thermoplasmata archaeon]
MKISEGDIEHGSIVVVPEYQDDLYVLKQVIRKGDFVTAISERRVETSSDKLRPEKAPKKKMKITIGVEETEFQEFSDRLRIRGRIMEAPVDIGSYHTINVELHNELTITRVNWLEQDLEYLRQAVLNNSASSIILLVLEEDEASIYSVRMYGVMEIMSFSRTGCKENPHFSGQIISEKDKRKDLREEFFSEIASHLGRLKNPGTQLVIAGPGFAPEDFFAYARSINPSFRTETLVVHTAQGGKGAVAELLRTGKISLNDRKEGIPRASIEAQAVEQWLEGIAKGTGSAYGPPDVMRELEAGSLKTLLVTDRFYRSADRKWFELARSMKTEVLVVSTFHEFGKTLENFGGVGGIRRWS